MTEPGLQADSSAAQRSDPGFCLGLRRETASRFGQDATTVPTWAALAVSVGTPVLTFVGVLIAQLISRKGANELELRSRREETLRVLRWAAELAVSIDDGKARLGVAR